MADLISRSQRAENDLLNGENLAAISQRKAKLNRILKTSEF